LPRCSSRSANQSMQYVRKLNYFGVFKLGSFLFFKVAMQANVPQPAADEDDGDDVDEGRWRHDSSAALSVIILNKKVSLFFITIFEPGLHLMLVNSTVQRLRGVIRSNFHVSVFLLVKQLAHFLMLIGRLTYRAEEAGALLGGGRRTRLEQCYRGSQSS
jgi:hypothetical protein